MKTTDPMKPAPPVVHKSSGLAALDPQSVAAEILAFLAADEERLSRFLALTGADPGDLRKASRRAGFAESLLDYLCGDEPLLVAFAGEHGYAPQKLGALHARLTSVGLDD